MTPMVANVSFGIYALMPLGWVFMCAVILLEIVIMSRLLRREWWSRAVVLPTVTANLLSGCAGFFVSDLIDGGWWSVVWMPWVSSNEVDLKHQFLALTAYYVCAFAGSIAIEGCAEWLMLRRRFPSGQIWKACIGSNAVSYLSGSIVMYSWSFGLWR